MADRNLLRLSATLLFIGVVASAVADALHPSRENPNNHVAVFTEYAHSTDWTAVHLGEFIGAAIIIAGLLVLFFALNVSKGPLRWLGFFGTFAAGVTLVLYGVRFAVDGVALKQAVDAWVSAPAGEQATRFASAEAMRWLEWGTASYQNFTQGLTLVLLAIVIVWTAKIPRLIGYLMGVSGLASLAVGWVLGSEGFAPIGAMPSYAAEVFLVVPIIWLLILAWRKKESVQAVPA